MRDATGAPGNGIDFITVGGALDVAAGATANSRFTIRIVSLDAANQPGPAANFDPSRAHSLTLLTAGGGITGFAANRFTLDHSAFQNDLAGGAFAIAQVGNELRLVFSPGALTPTGTAATATLRSDRVRDDHDRPDRHHGRRDVDGDTRSDRVRDDHDCPDRHHGRRDVDGDPRSDRVHDDHDRPDRHMGGATSTATPSSSDSTATPVVPLPTPPRPRASRRHGSANARPRSRRAPRRSSTPSSPRSRVVGAENRRREARGHLPRRRSDDDAEDRNGDGATPRRNREASAAARTRCAVRWTRAPTPTCSGATSGSPACPGFAGGCTDVIADRDCGDIATCLGCIGGAAVDQAIALAYGVTPADPKAAKAQNACQRAIGKSAVQLFGARSKALQTCWDKVSSGKISGPCPDAAKAAPALVKATARLTAGIAAACCGKNKTCNLADGGVDADFDPVIAIGFRTQCDALVVPGGQRLRRDDHRHAEPDRLRRLRDGAR